MHLHRRFSDTHIVGHLFVESAGRGLDHDLALTGAKRVETFPEHSQRLFALSTGTIASQTSFDCIEKVLITERFREELYRPPFIACTVIGISHVEHEAGRADLSMGIGIEKLSNR